MREVESVWKRFGGIRNTVVLAPGTPQPLCQPFINVPIFYDDFILLYIGNGCETPSNHPFETGGLWGSRHDFPRQFFWTFPRSEREIFEKFEVEARNPGIFEDFGQATSASKSWENLEKRGFFVAATYMGIVLYKPL